MSDETTEAILGDAVAASLEKPGRRRRGLFGWKKQVQDEPPPLTHCEDCGAELHGHFCSNCGQVAVDYHRSFRHVVADVAESFPELGLQVHQDDRPAHDFSRLADEPIRRGPAHALPPSTSGVPAGQHRFLFVRALRAAGDQAESAEGSDAQGSRGGRASDEESGHPRRRPRASVGTPGRAGKSGGDDARRLGCSFRGSVADAPAPRQKREPGAPTGRCFAAPLAETKTAGRRSVPTEATWSS